MSDTEGEHTLPTVSVRVHGATYGLPSERVRHVSRAVSISRVPFCERHVAGIASLNGRVLSVLDLGVRLQNRPSRRDGYLAVVRTGGSAADIALLVDEVVGLVDVLASEVQDAPAEARAGLPEEAVRGIVVQADGGVLVLLDPDAVVNWRDTANHVNSQGRNVP